MADKSILHMVTPLQLMSPFDVNMATDAGFDMIAVYTGVEQKDVPGLVQDAIFSRNPKLAARTGMFFGGRLSSYRSLPIPPAPSPPPPRWWPQSRSA